MLDVYELTQFYQSPLGKIAKRVIQEKIKDFWRTNSSIKKTLVLGYGCPFEINSSLKKNHFFYLMFAQQGAIPFPNEENNLCVLSYEDDFPFLDEEFDHILIVHGLEQVRYVPLFFREVWRVLKSNGKVLFILPNRRGLWARFDHTPFGQGTPYTMTQVTTLLSQHSFNVIKRDRCLFIPPIQHRFINYFPSFEKAGNLFFGKFSGLVCIEASKQLYIPAPTRSTSKKWKRVWIGQS